MLIFIMEYDKKINHKEFAYLSRYTYFYVLHMCWFTLFLNFIPDSELKSSLFTNLACIAIIKLRNYVCLYKFK